jgi:hypothetical protein
MAISIKEEFLANPETGLVKQIAEYVADTFGFPDANGEA